MLHKYIGDRTFYRRVMALTLPIIIQNGITQLVNMLDNVMVGQVGTVEMTGVAIANQLIFVFNLCIFGAVSGAGIFGAQFYGNGDHQGVRYTLRYKLILSAILIVLGLSVLSLADEPLISLYLKGEGSVTDAAASLQYGKQYLRIMLIGLIPFSLVQCYAGTLRETGKSVLPMVAGVIAVCTNLFLNYVLIFGHFGAPKMGVAGAAVATVISRFVELFIVAIATHARPHVNAFAVGLYRSLHIPKKLVGQITVKGLPLMFNETFWSMGMVTLNGCYSLRGLDVVAANNISSTFFNLFSVVFMAVGVANGILLGQQLGAGQNEDAKRDCTRLMAFSLAVSIVTGAIYFFSAGFISQFYNTTDTVRDIATNLMRITALAMPIDAVAHASYFTLRAGGKTVITILFDSCFTWGISVLAALLLVHFTSLSILWVYGIVQALNILKAAFGIYLVKKGVWIRNIVAETT